MKNIIHKKADKTTFLYFELRFAVAIPFYILLFVFVTTSCSRVVTTPDGGMGLPIRLASPSYPIDVFFANQVVEESYIAIGPVKIEKEVELTKAEMKEKMLIGRGNDEEQKRALLDQLIIQGVAMGANALVNVRYKYYTAATYQGFVLEGTAVKYEVREK
jgi:hypothetical protein